MCQKLSSYSSFSRGLLGINRTNWNISVSISWPADSAHPLFLPVRIQVSCFRFGLVFIALEQGMNYAPYTDCLMLIGQMSTWTRIKVECPYEAKIGAKIILVTSGGGSVSVATRDLSYLKSKTRQDKIVFVWSRSRCWIPTFIFHVLVARAVTPTAAVPRLNSSMLQPLAESK